MTLFIIRDRLALEMKIKKLVIIFIGCFALASCATFDPKTDTQLVIIPLKIFQ
jgi:hypothetical protein